MSLERIGLDTPKAAQGDRICRPVVAGRACDAAIQSHTRKRWSMRPWIAAPRPARNDNSYISSWTALRRLWHRRMMFNLALLPAFMMATVVLLLIPGPNVALIVANSVAYGPRYGLLTVAGTSTAVVLQLALTGLGMTEVLGALGHGFQWLRWIGAAYLVWIGVQQWRAAPTDLTRTAPQPRSARAIYGRAVLVSLTNPKTLLFYGAFFPQFIVPSHGVAAQVLTLSAVFLILAIMIDSLWAFAAGRARSVLAVHGRLRNRLSGGMLVGAGVGLALARPK